MRFNRFGGGDDDYGGGGRHQQGFADGLVEGLLVRRRIDRQNKIDKMNEQYAKKEMEMKESEERDRVLQAALQRRKMEAEADYAPEVNQSLIDQRRAAAARSTSGVKLNEARTATENELRPQRNAKLIAEAIRAKREKVGKVIDLTEPQVRDYVSSPDKYWALDKETRLVVDGAALDLGLQTPKKNEVSTFKPTQPKNDSVAKEARSAFLKVMNNADLVGDEKDAALANIAETYPDHVEAVSETTPGKLWGTNTTTKYRLKTPASEQKKGATGNSTTSDPWAKYK